MTAEPMAPARGVPNPVCQLSAVQLPARDLIP